MPNTFVPFLEPYQKEKSSFTLSAYFRDDANAADTPATVEYRIDCLSTNKNILAWTSVTPGENVSITVKPSENAIQNEGHRKERKQITVAADRNTDTETRDTAIWICENIEGFDG